MRRRLLGSSLGILLVAGLLSQSALAQGSNNTGLSPDEQRLAELHAAIAAQQERIGMLEQQVVATGAGGAQVGQTELIREQIRALLSEQEFRESLAPAMLQAGYDGGFFIRSSDDLFLMKVKTCMQFRWTHYGTSSRNKYRSPRLERDDRTGFDIQRLRPSFRGHVYSPDLTYEIQLDMSSDGGYDASAYYGYVNYRFAEEFQVMLGLFKLAGTRGQMISSGSFQFVDLPLTDEVFQLGRGVGVRFWGRMFDKRLRWYVDVVNSLRGQNNRTITTDEARELDNNPAIVTHLLWHVLGDKPGSTWRSQSDMPMHEMPALELGVHYAFNDDAGDRGTLRIPFRRNSVMPGAYGLTTSNGMQIHQLGTDLAFRWQGFSINAEYIWRFIDPRRANRTPFTPYTLLTGIGDTENYHGGYMQMGYFLPIPGLENQVEVVGRFGGVAGVDPGNEGSWEYGGGLNYYIKGHDVKLQADMVKVYEWPNRTASGSLANCNDDALVFRVQLQVQF
jgi:hypothetical protein